jgi:hypothetical protein
VTAAAPQIMGSQKSLKTVQASATIVIQANILM